MTGVAQELIRDVAMIKTHFLRNGKRSGAYGRFRGLALAALGLAVSACAQSPTSLDRSSLASGASAREALALPPPGGPEVVGVVERRYSNAIEQEIALATSSSLPGQNVLRVQFFGPVGSEGSDNALPVRILSEGAIAREMRQAFPGVAMVRSPVYVQNTYGPFGYAVGRRGADELCFYGWQRIANLNMGAPFANVGVVQVRLRLCQTGTTEQALLSVMYGYTINASFSSGFWNPYGAPPGPDPRLGNTGQPIYPQGAMGPVTVLDPAPVATVPRVPAARAAPVETAPQRPQVPANAPIVPPPPSAAAGQAQAPVVPPPPAE